MDARLMGLDGHLMSTLHHLVDLPDEVEKALNAPTRTYVRDARAMAATPADVKELPGVYVFVVDMPELKPNEIKVQVEDDCVLVVSGERRRKEEEEEEKEVKYLRMERRMGKFMRRFSLPDNANADVVSATYKDGVLTITVEKLPPPEPKKTKTIEVKVA
ncbi:17.0 kDa class II heat shock protein-like [Musa acuminata AAA Group]|uniref:17.0 kDa class II heat shock protein-like n=1 Tax=Musa acuminata AAA Group TaxID=214697 RepID=UPI0031E23273